MPFGLRDQRVVDAPQVHATTQPQASPQRDEPFGCFAPRAVVGEERIVDVGECTQRVQRPTQLGLELHQIRVVDDLSHVSVSRRLQRVQHKCTGPRAGVGTSPSCPQGQRTSRMMVLPV
jgi:hypothetical protein